MNNSYIARASKIASRVLGNETLIMLAADSTIFTLNEVGSAIWDAADGKTPLQQIVEQKVCQEFEVDPSQALADAEKFVADLAAQGVLRVAETPMEEGS
jgi:hypothetical protein